MVLTLPMFLALRERFPTARLTLFTRSYVGDLVEGLTCIDEVVYVDKAVPSGAIPAGPIDTTPETFDLRSAIRLRGIDTVFFPRATFNEAWTAFRARVRNRIGTANRWYSRLYTTRIREHRSHAEFHEAEYNVRMILHAFGPPQPTVHLVRPMAKPAPSGGMLESTHTHDPASMGYIVVHPGSMGSSPRWPIECFGNAAQRLRTETGCQIVVTGVDSESALCATVAAMCPDALNVCGKYTLGEMMSVLAGAKLLIANATGTLHLAASLGTPVVGFYPNAVAIGATRWRPYTTLARVLTSTANDDMATITVEDCVRAAHELLLTS